MLPSERGSALPAGPTPPLPHPPALSLDGPPPAVEGRCTLCGVDSDTAVPRPVPWRLVVCEDCWTRHSTPPADREHVGLADAEAGPAAATSAETRRADQAWLDRHYPPPAVAAVDDPRCAPAGRGQAPAPRPRGVLVSTSGVTPPPLRPRRTTALYGWASKNVQVVVDQDDVLRLQAPERVFAGITGWPSRLAWLAALRAHPRLAEAARARGVAVASMLLVLPLLSTYALARTGRGIMVADRTLAAQLGVCTKVVQRARWAGEDLGLLERVLDGSDMPFTLRERLRHHRCPHGCRAGAPNHRGRRCDTRSKLPNVYAATIPKWLARCFVDLDETDLDEPAPEAAAVHSSAVPEPPVDGGLPKKVHPPVGETNRGKSLGPAGKNPNDDNASRTDPAGRAPTKDQPENRADWTFRPRRGDPRTVALAQDLRARLFWVRSTPSWQLRPTLDRFAKAGWTAKDITDALTRLNERRGWKSNPRPRRPYAYLAALLRQLEPTDLVADREHDAALAATAARWGQLRRTGPRCPHQVPAGALPDPATGVPPCPTCRA